MQLKPNTFLQNGKYRIIRVLGQGGFGITYLAENVVFDKMVAIKEFFPKDFCGRDHTSHLTLGTQNNGEIVSKLKDRFLKEAKNIARLDYSGIVKIHDIFEENDTAYYVMDYIEGETLNELVKRNGPLSESKAVEYIKKVGNALDYIHSRNMTHFDVKPANIVIRKKDDIPVLIDFGLSKQYDIHGDATSTLMQGVSNGYSPIELYNTGSITSFSPQSDIYSLGATLYFLLTGSIPPAAPDLLEAGLTFPFHTSFSLKNAIRSAMEVSRVKRPKVVSTFTDALIGLSKSSTSINCDTENEKNDATRIINPGIYEKKTFQERKTSDTVRSSGQNVIVESKGGSYYKQVILVAVILVVIICMIGITKNEADDAPVFYEPQSEAIDNVDQPKKIENIKLNISGIGAGIYSGEINEFYQPNGKGRLDFTDGVALYYEGEWVDGYMTGESTYVLRNGDKFVGKFDHNEYSYGTYTTSTGTTYKGSFKNKQPYEGDVFSASGEKVKHIQNGRVI